jgi:hypothetical protein
MHSAYFDEYGMPAFPDFFFGDYVNRQGLK